MFYLYDPRVTQSIDLQWFLVSYLFCLGRIYCHVRFASLLVLHGWLFILNFTFYAALLLQEKKKESTGNIQYRGKDRQHRKKMPEVLYRIYTVYISHE